MKSGPGFRARRAAILAAVALSLTAAACASATPRQSVEPEPASCTYPSVVELRAELSDSLSERESQRIQSLERNCALARAGAARETGGRTRDHHGWWIGSGLAMALMMFAMWSPW